MPTRPGDYCINCAALQRSYGGYPGSREIAVDCGNHVWGNTYDDQLAKKERDIFAMWMAERLKECGFADVGCCDVQVTDEHQFRFAHRADLSWKQLRKLSGEFRTDKIHWTEDNYTDTAGTHTTGYVTVWAGGGLRESFAAGPPEQDAPDGVVMLLEDRGGYFARSGDTWRPVTWKEFRDYEAAEQKRRDDEEDLYPDWAG